MTLHATALEWFGKGFLLLGSSASGKSDLALRLIDNGANLISDDQIIISNENDSLIAKCPDNLQGKLEVRGVGIIKTPFYAVHSINLCFNLQKTVDRFPKKNLKTFKNITIPCYQLNPFEVSAPIKIKHLIHHMNFMQ